MTVSFSTLWNSRKPTTSAIIGPLGSSACSPVSSNSSGRISKLTTPSRTPAVKPRIRCKRSRNFSANRPPADVEKKVVSESSRALMQSPGVEGRGAGTTAGCASSQALVYQRALMMLTREREARAAGFCAILAPHLPNDQTTKQTTKPHDDSRADLVHVAHELHYATYRRCKSDSPFPDHQLPADRGEHRALRLRAVARRTTARPLYRDLGRALDRCDRAAGRRHSSANAGADQIANLDVSPRRLATRRR